jgi:hypothetical protein
VAWGIVAVVEGVGSRAGVAEGRVFTAGGAEGGVGVAEGIGKSACMVREVIASEGLLEDSCVCVVGKAVANDVDRSDFPRSVLSTMT